MFFKPTKVPLSFLIDTFLRFPLKLTATCMAKRKKRVPRKEKKEPKASIEFCKKCGAILVPKKKGKSVSLTCRRCGYEVKKPVKALKIVEEKKTQKGIIILEKDYTLLPMTERECEKCGNKQAWYWLQQTRSADEPPTQFFRCTKCRHVWREYK